MALWAARRFLPGATRAREDKPLDLAGAVTGAVAVGGVTFALIEGPAHGWTAPALSSAVGGAASLVAFLQLERRPEAMMPLSLFRDAGVRRHQRRDLAPLRGAGVSPSSC